MNIDQLIKEMRFKAVRSSGPGGQHVSKVATKVAVNFHIASSLALSDAEKELLQTRLANRITAEGDIIMQCGDTRSQHRNKLLVMSRLIELLKQNLKVSKPRKKSRPSKRAIEKRLKAKRAQALKKANRKTPPTD